MLGVERVVLCVVHLHLGEPEGLVDAHDVRDLVGVAVRAAHNVGAGGDAAEGHRGAGAEDEGLGGDGRDLVNRAELGVGGLERIQGPAFEG